MIQELREVTLKCWEDRNPRAKRGIAVFPDVLLSRTKPACNIACIPSVEE